MSGWTGKGLVARRREREAKARPSAVNVSVLILYNSVCALGGNKKTIGPTVRNYTAYTAVCARYIPTRGCSSVDMTAAAAVVYSHLRRRTHHFDGRRRRGILCIYIISNS